MTAEDIKNLPEGKKISVTIAGTDAYNDQMVLKAGVIVEENASEWNGELEDTSGGQEGIKIPGYGEITVEAGSTTWNIILANPEDNSCYFKYEITIDDSETPIYESNWIEPGMAVEQFEVTEALEAGDYEIHLNISACTMDESHTLLNGADVMAVLHVI